MISQSTYCSHKKVVLSASEETIHNGENGRGRWEMSDSVEVGACVGLFRRVPGHAMDIRASATTVLGLMESVWKEAHSKEAN